MSRSWLREENTLPISLMEKINPRPQKRAGNRNGGAMSLLFSVVTITPKQGLAVTVNESGHPDEYDMRELLRYETRYAAVRKTEFHGATIKVCQYRFQVKGRDKLTERDSFALMAAYNELALRYSEKPFVRRDDVELVEQYDLQLDLCTLCSHRGLLAMDDVGACNCCDEGEFFSPDTHAGQEVSAK